jgi:predicted transcriptional regulator
MQKLKMQISLDESLDTKIRIEAAKCRTNPSEVISIAVSEYLERQSKKGGAA